MLLKNSDKYFDFKLKPQQEQAFSMLTSFIEDNEHKAFTLRGYAGTGKTTLMSGLIKWLDEYEIKHLLLASTARAAKILSNKTNKKAYTIHSQIYVFEKLSEDLEYINNVQDNISVDDTGQISLLFGLREKISNDKTVYIIDEASMISDVADKISSFAQFGNGNLLNDILNFDKDGKYVFIGDPCQLPPINQFNSPALFEEVLTNKYSLKVIGFELKHILRQKESNGIIKAAFELRKLREKNPSKKFADLPLKGFNDIFFYHSHIDLINKYIEQIRQNGIYHSILICQTNKHCQELNRIIRSILHKVELYDLIVGDLLMVTQNNYLTPLVNGDQVIVKKIGGREYRANISFIQIEVEEVFSKIVYSLLLIENILYSPATNLNDKQHKDLMIDYFKRMQIKGIKQKDKKFKDSMLSDPYLNALKVVYGYAITCHKSQGGEWDEVYLYLDNKIHGIPKPSIYQWWYTAITRAKNKLHVVDDWFIK